MAIIRLIFAKIHSIMAIICCNIVLVGLASCSEDDPISRRYPCRFVFVKEQHPTSIIFSACQSPGSYVFVTTKVDAKKVRHVYAQSNDGKTPTEDNLIATDREANYTGYLLGASNDIGLIMGLTNFNGLAAFDRICPNCATLHALDWAGNRQKVACKKCQRTYDLETGAIVAGGSGDALLRYVCNYNGLQLSVGN